jgi:hypothetical protein
MNVLPFVVIRFSGRRMTVNSLKPRSSTAASEAPARSPAVPADRRQKREAAERETKSLHNRWRD